MMQFRPTIEETAVPCNGCTLCCKGDAIFLHPLEGDDPSKYQTVEAYNPISKTNALMLDHKPNGDCIYLEGGGCSIYNGRPLICRKYDCRKQFLSLTKAIKRMTIEKGFASPDTYEAGKKRQWSLSRDERQECIKARAQR